jgi:hypothetical protein
MSSKYALGIAAAAGLGLYLFRDQLRAKFAPSVSTADAKGALPAAPINIGAGSGVMFRRGGAAALTQAQGTSLLNLGTPPPPGGGSTGGGIGARDIGAAVGASAAVAGCAATGIGAAGAALCGSAGAWAGDQTVKYGEQAGKAIGNAAKDVGSWVKGLF